MFLFPIRWDKIRLKEGDNVTVVLTPVQRALLIAAVLNIQSAGEAAPNELWIVNDSDNFDAVVSDLQSKLASAT